MKYTTRHYVDVARILSSVRSQDADERTMSKVEKEFIFLFKSDNPRFDRDRFEIASK